MIFPKTFTVRKPALLRTLPQSDAPVIGNVEPTDVVQVVNGSEKIDGVYWLQVMVYMPMYDENGYLMVE
jgi:hypothetical protein